MTKKKKIIFVTKDIPDGVVACGNLSRVIRKITDEDKKYWEDQALDFYKDLNKK